MRSRPTKSTNLRSSSCEGNGHWDWQEFPECPDGDNNDAEKDEESTSRANKQKEEDEDEPARCTPAAESLLLTIIKEMEEMLLRLGFSQTVAMKLVDDQVIESPWTLASLSDEDIVTTCDMIRRPGSLASGKMPEREWRTSSLQCSCLRLCNIAPRPPKLDVSATHLCCSTSISGSWNIRKLTMLRHPKLTRTIGRKLWRT